MATYDERRSYKRCPYKAPIGMSFFNSGQWLEAQTLNHCKKGMCIKSNINFQPGSTLLIKTKNYPSKDSCPCAFEGLLMTTLGEIKWCRKMHDAISPIYETGVKYYAPHY